MTAKRPGGETFEKEPLKKCGRSEESNMDHIDAQLDDEVEKELQEFELLQSGLLDPSTKQGNGKTVGASNSQTAGRGGMEQEQGKSAVMRERHAAEREKMEQDIADGSDMELDDLEQGIAEARKTKTVQQHVSNHSFLKEAVSPKDTRLLRKFEEENLLDALVENSGTLENLEEGCKDMEQMPFTESSNVVLPPFTPQETDSKLNLEQTPLPDAQELLRSAQELLRSQRQSMEAEYLDEDPNDPDFPSPGKRKSRAKTSRSRSRRSQQWQFSPEKPRANQENLTPKPSMSRSESEKIYPSLPGTSQIRHNPSNLEPFLPKDVFVDPVLKIPVQPKSMYADPDFRDPIFDHVSKPKARHMRKSPVHGQRHIRAIDFDQTATQNHGPEVQHPKPKSPEPVNPKLVESRTDSITPKACLDFLRNSKLANPATDTEEQDSKEQAPSAGNQSDDPQSTKVAISSICDKPAEYCVVERIIQRRFKNSFLLDSEKLDMTADDRPEIWCPELFPYTTVYENHKWLAACNELRRFFCWPCLLFASKVIWSVTGDENSENVFGKEIHKHLQSAVHMESVKQRDAMMSKKKSSSIIYDLLLENFVIGTWTDQRKETIILKGRPRPVLDNKTDQQTKEQEILAFKEFYDKFRWICGCTKSNKFCCWPCLLFGRATWSSAGTMKSIEASLLVHEATPQHMGACLKLGKWESDLRMKSKAIDEEMEKTRNFLKYIVEILCAEKKKINNVEFSPLDFVESIETMSRYDEKLRILIDEKSKHSSIAQIVPQYTAVILDSVEFFIKSSILEEIKSSKFVSLIFDHSSGLSNKAVLSVIARYVDGKGLVHERFVKLLNVGYNTPSNLLIDEFFQIIAELQCRSTLIGFTYDGYLVKPGNIADFNAKVEEFCPNAKFFHYSEHTLKRVLKQTLCHVPTCRRVLQAVKELASFFESTPNARQGLLDIVSAAEKSQNGEVWRSSDFLTTVFIYHAVIVEIMESITTNSQDWKIKTVVQASNFLDFFNDSTNRFYVTMMARIFNTVEELSKEVDSDIGIENFKTFASHAALKIQKLGRSFDNLVESACSHLEKSEQQRPRQEMQNLREQFSNVVRLVVKLVKNRILGLESGYFKTSAIAPTSNSMHFIKLKRRVFRNLALPPNFNSTRLSQELKFFHGSPDFSEFDLPELIAVLNKYSMTQVLPELYKFLLLAVTVPEKYDDSVIPAVRRISAFIEGKKDINSMDALIWMEKEFISNLQKETNFYDQVIDRVLAITKKDSFVHSTV